MLKVIIFGAALIAVPVFVSIPASADHLGGGPLRSGDGKCWADNFSGSRDGRFGYWHECPQKAAGGASDCGIGHQAWEKAHIGMSFYDFCNKGDAAGLKSQGNAAGPKSQGDAAGLKSQGNAFASTASAKQVAHRTAAHHGALKHVPADAYGSHGAVQPIRPSQLTGDGLGHDRQLEGRF